MSLNLESQQVFSNHLNLNKQIFKLDLTSSETNFLNSYFTPKLSVTKAGLKVNDIRWDTNDYIARRMNCSVATVKRVIRSLVKKQIIVKKLFRFGLKLRKSLQFSPTFLMRFLDSKSKKSNDFPKGHGEPPRGVTVNPKLKPKNTKTNYKSVSPPKGIEPPPKKGPPKGSPTTKKSMVNNLISKITSKPRVKSKYLDIVDGLFPQTTGKLTYDELNRAVERICVLGGTSRAKRDLLAITRNMPVHERIDKFYRIIDILEAEYSRG